MRYLRLIKFLLYVFHFTSKDVPISVRFLLNFDHLFKPFQHDDDDNDDEDDDDDDDDDNNYDDGVFSSNVFVYDYNS